MKNILNSLAKFSASKTANTSLKWVAAATMIVIVIVASALVAMQYSGLFTLTTNPLPGQATPTPTAIPSAGSIPLTLNLPFLIFNSTAVGYTSASPQVLLFANSAVPANLVGAQSTSSPYALTGSIIQGNSYVLLVAPASAGTYGTLDDLAAAGQGVILGTPSVITYQGAFWTEYPITFTNLGQISTGYTATVNLVGYQAATAATASLLNSTALGASSYGYATTTSYFTSTGTFNFGQGYKITRMQVIVGQNASVGAASGSISATNATAYDNGQYALNSAIINFGNGLSMTVPANHMTWSGTTTAIVEIGSPSGAMYISGASSGTFGQQFYGIPVLYGQSDSPTGTMTINLNWYGKGTDTFIAALKIYYVSPTGTLGTYLSAVQVT